MVITDKRILLDIFMIYYEEEVKYIEKRRPELTGKLHDFWEITGDFLFVIFYGFEIIYIL
jgi:hypothetical protein